MDADAVIERAVAAARGVAVPEGPGAEVQGRVLAIGRSAVTARRGRLVRWGIAALVVMTIGGMWQWMGSSGGEGHGTAGVALAEVMGKLREVKTVQYREATSQPGILRLVVTRETVDMAGRYARTEVLGSDGNGGERVRAVAIYNEGRMLNLNLETRTGTLTDYTNGGKDAPHRLAGTHTLEDLMKVPTGDAKSLGEKVEGGRKVRGFEVVKAPSTYEVWADEETKLPVRVVETVRPARSKVIIGLPANDVDMHPEQYTVVRTLTEIRFDVGVEGETFSLSPPQGFVVREQKVGG